MVEGMTFPTPTRSPDAIMFAFDEATAAEPTEFGSPREILHEIIADLMNTLQTTLAQHPRASVGLNTDVMMTMEDYVVNHYGDD